MAPPSAEASAFMVQEFCSSSLKHMAPSPFTPSLFFFSQPLPGPKVLRKPLLPGSLVYSDNWLIAIRGLMQETFNTRL